MMRKMKEALWSARVTLATLTLLIISSVLDAPQTSKEGLQTLIEQGRLQSPPMQTTKTSATGPPALLVRGGFEPGPSVTRRIKTDASRAVSRR